MGTYCQLYVANFPVISEKSQACPFVMTLFRETDKRIFTRRTRDRNPIDWGHVEWDPEKTETVVEYTATVTTVKDRLRVMGFTLVRVETEFYSLKEACLADMTESFYSFQEADGNGCPEGTSFPRCRGR